MGKAVVSLLQAIDIPVRAYVPLLAQDSHPELAGWEQVSQADILCLHTPLTSSGPFPSRHMLAADSIALLPANQVLLNAGRGGVIDNDDLLAAMVAGQQLQLVLDVWENEPDIATRLLPHTLLATPHIAGYSYDGKLAATAW